MIDGEKRNVVCRYKNNLTLRGYFPATPALVRAGTSFRVETGTFLSLLLLRNRPLVFDMLQVKLRYCLHFNKNMNNGAQHQTTRPPLLQICDTRPQSRTADVIFDLVITIRGLLKFCRIQGENLCV